MSIAQLQTLAKKFCPDQEKVLLQEWFSFKNHIITGSLEVSENLSLSLSLSLFLLCALSLIQEQEPGGAPDSAGE